MRVFQKLTSVSLLGLGLIGAVTMFGSVGTGAGEKKSGEKRSAENVQVAPLTAVVATRLVAPGNEQSDMLAVSTSRPNGLPYIIAAGSGDANLNLTEHSNRDRRPQYRELNDARSPAGYVVPVEGVVARSLVDTWGGARSEGRSHEGIDIFAKRNTPIIAATDGVILRQGETERGGKVVWVAGPGGLRHYYAHLEEFSDHQPGDRVKAGEIIGYVGNSGNAATTPPHLHYGVYTAEGAINPYPLLTGKPGLDSKKEEKEPKKEEKKEVPTKIAATEVEPERIDAEIENATTGDAAGNDATGADSTGASSPHGVAVASN